MANQNEMQVKIDKARNEGYSDTEIFNFLKTSPKYAEKFSTAAKEGYSSSEIATHLGLKVVDKGRMPTITVDAKEKSGFQPFDWKASQKEGMAQAAKDAGKTQAWESGLLGLSDLGAGVVQGATYAADGISGVLNKLLGTNLDTKSYERFTKERKDIEDLHNLRREANDQGFDGWRLGGAVAGAAPIALTGGGGLLGVAGRGALSGGLISQASFAKDSDTRSKNAAVGAIGGAVGGVIGKKIGDGVVRGYNAVKNNMRSGAKEIIEQGEKHGVSTSVGDVGRNPIIQKAEVLNEQVPIFGTSSFRAGQQQEAKVASNKVVEKLQGKMSEANYKSLHKIQEAANNGDRNAARIFKIVEDAKDDSSKILQAAAEVRAWREGNLASKLYDEAGDIAKAQGGMVQPSNTLSSLNSRIAQENGSLRPNKELLKELVDIQKRLNSSNVSKDFSNMRLLRSELGDLADSYANGVNPNLPAAKFFGDLRSNVEKDISDYALNSGNNALKSAYKRADSYYKSIMLTRDKATAKAMQSNKPDEIFNQFVKVGKGDRAANFYQNLDPKGQAALRYEMANQALNKATNSSNDVFSPAKFAREFERLQEPYQNIFKGSDKAEMDGFVKLMRHVERAGQYAENPPTGNRLAFGAVTVASLPVATKIATQAALTKTLFTTPTGRRILLAAKDLPPGSEGLENLLKMAQKLSTTTGSNLSKQNQ